jgi:energy-coupling factor transporter ATP-binding protein EcfA2
MGDNRHGFAPARRTAYFPQSGNMAQYVFSMNRVTKTVPPKRQILKDVSISFFPGAKIGVLGLNGSGKSTLLKIMAGIDKEIEGEAIPMPGIQIGYLPQEPQLDPEQTCARRWKRASAARWPPRRPGRGVRRLRRAKTPTSTPWPPSRPSSKPSSPPAVPKTPTCSSNSPPTR